ncbi:MAG: acyl-CoA dehydrogenase [Porticoccaceae bacterium]|nr:acyl-CoA dehydrogenase [Porticoccaceae bacterium]
MTTQAKQSTVDEFESFIFLAIQKTYNKINFSEELESCSSPTQLFPFKFWKNLADQNLLHHFLPQPGTTDKNLHPLPYKQLAQAGYIMTRTHQSLGLTMTWLGQLLKSSFLCQLGHNDHAYIESILNGDSICALAISEPHVGAHPKYLSCTAAREGKDYIINGEKAFVSHGPYADRFIVLAITEQNLDRKHYSAFLVPADNPGLKLLPPQPIKGLQPSSHCNVVFSNCRIPSNALIGTKGQAFAEISLPMRTLEDVLMLAPIAGAIQAQLDYLAKADTSHNDPLDTNTIGELLCLAESAKELGILAASRLDQQTRTPDLTSLIVGFRSLAKEVQARLLEWHDEYPGLCELAADIETLCNIGRQATATRTSALAQRFLLEHKQLA